MVRIFVSVASYRDRRVYETVESAFRNAARPADVECGVLAQNRRGDDLPPIRRPSVRYVETFEEAKGPLSARQWIVRELYRGQPLFLQVDAHTTFLPGWDQGLLDQLFMTAPRPSLNVLTTHPPPPRYRRARAVPVLRRTAPYSRDPRVSCFRAVMEDPRGPRPVPQQYVGAGLLFGTEELARAYPALDLPYLFQGEEELLTLHLASRNFRFFAPARSYLLHEYNREGRPPIFDEVPGFRQKEKRALDSFVRWKERRRRPG